MSLFKVEKALETRWSSFVAGELLSLREVGTVFKSKGKSLSLSSRFSSGDLSSEFDDEGPNASTGLASVGRQDSAASQNYQGLAERPPPLQSQPQSVPPPSQPVPGAPPPGSDLSLNLRPSSRTTSAPSSPAKTRESLLQRVQSLTGAARDQASFPSPLNLLSVVLSLYV